MNITVEFKGLKEVIANIEGLARTQIPYAAMKALNKVSQDVKDAEVKQMSQSLDRPTPYTLNSLYIKYATKANLSSELGYKDKSQSGKGNPAANWMQPEVEGGKRNAKRFEVALQRIGVLPKGMYVVPGAACQLDAYGNIPAGLIVQILSYFQALGEQGYRGNMKPEKIAALAKGSKRTKTMGFEYFVSYGKGTWSGRQHLPAGIYKRIGFAQGSAIKPIMMFVKAPSYQKRFPFYEIAQKTINQMLLPRFDEALLTMKRTG